MNQSDQLRELLAKATAGAPKVTRIAGVADGLTRSARGDLLAWSAGRAEATAEILSALPSLLDRITELTNGLREATEAIGVCIDGFEKSNPTRGGLAAIHMLKEARERYQALLSTQTGEG